MSTQALKHLGLGVALLAVPATPGAALARDAAPSPQPSSLLSTARTIQVQETLLRAGGGGKLPPPYHVAVNIERPNKVKLVVAPNMGRKRSDLYVSDGTTEYEYDGGTGNYQRTTLAADGKSKSLVRGMTVIDLLLKNGVLPAPAPGVTRTVTADAVGGKAMTVATDLETIKAPDGTKTDIIGKVWSEADTHLPYRLTAASVTKGVTTLYEDVTFSGWVFNKPIPAALLAWTPPAGAKLYGGESGLLAAGTPAPDFAAVTPGGRAVHLSDYKGKVVVLDFWATWCGPCQSSMPHLESVYKQVKGQNVAVLGLCVWDQPAAYKSWVAAKSKMYTFPTAFDPAGHGAKNIAGSLYNVTSIPTQYVIDEDGKVAAAYSGYAEGDPQLEKALVAQGITLPAGTKAAAAKP